MAVAIAGCGGRGGCRPPLPPPSRPALPPPVAAPPPADVILSPATRAIPGGTPTPLLAYRAAPGVKAVAVAGSWTAWRDKTPLTPSNGLWVLDIRALKPRSGRHEYKFLSDGIWESGANRVLHVNAQGWLERPLDWIFSAAQVAASRVTVILRPTVQARADIRVRLEPELPVSGARWLAGGGARGLAGCELSERHVTFVFDERVYGVALRPDERAAVAGSFNGWSADGWGGQWALSDPDDDGIWEGTFSRENLRAEAGQPYPQFKFVVNGSRWMEPPAGAPNARGDGRGHRNLEIGPAAARAPTLSVETAAPLRPDVSYAVVIEGLAEKPLRHGISPLPALDAVRSDRPLGAWLDRAAGRTGFRVFAPRASAVTLELFDGPAFERPGATPDDPPIPLPARAAHPLSRADDGTWSVELPGLLEGAYFTYRVEGPAGDGEGFDTRARIGDPYARAAAHAGGCAIVIDPAATNAWFGGWTDQAWRTPAADDVVLYEAHLRDLTSDPSARVPPALRGTCEGLLASDGTGAGLDHLRALGVNVIELMPLAEFDNGVRDHGWGYNTAYYFAPEASYGRAPLTGSAYYEFKRLVDGLHARGFAVVLDVVYNHVGSPNVFDKLDRKYYFRLNPDDSHSNFSGCGNDVRTEAPMMRRLIVDNIVYWMREFHVDGYRFDLAELVDRETLLAVRDAARAINPRALLISEPWSFRGDHKREMRGTGWACWNNEFRDAAKAFVRGRGDVARLRAGLAGSGALWTATPADAINYLESHDDRALADELSSNPGGDGRRPQPADALRNRMAAALLFTARGIPMLHAGQEFLRSKAGESNTYNRGDALNALRWTDRERPLAAETLAFYRGLIAWRRSPAAESVRSLVSPAAGYFQGLETPGDTTLGYLLNGDHALSGAAVAVLFNAGETEAGFRLSLPAGRWRMISDGTRFDPKGLGPVLESRGPATLPPVRIEGPGMRMYQDGF